MSRYISPLQVPASHTLFCLSVPLVYSLSIRIPELPRLFHPEGNPTIYGENFPDDLNKA